MLIADAVATASLCFEPTTNADPFPFEGTQAKNFCLRCQEADALVAIGRKEVHATVPRADHTVNLHFLPIQHFCVRDHTLHGHCRSGVRHACRHSSEQRECCYSPKVGAHALVDSLLWNVLCGWLPRCKG